MPETCTYCSGDAVDKCSVCGKPICQDHTERTLPFLTLEEMLKTIFQTLLRAPATLPALLTEPGEEESFCPECYRANAQRRVREQRKFLYLALILTIVCVAVVVLLLVRPW